MAKRSVKARAHPKQGMAGKSRVLKNKNAESDGNLEQPTKRRKITELGSLIKSFTRSPSPDLPKKVDTSSYDQWVDKYAPQEVASVAIHSRKLKDVKEELISMLRHDSTTKLLILSGPAGSSKSTIIKALSHELIPHNDETASFVEWINPIETNPSQFDDFLSAAKYRTGKNLALILVEDLPNVFHLETRERFQKSLMQWIYTDVNLPPLVICITECDFAQDERITQGYNIETSFTAETIIGNKILNSVYCKRIKFNPVNTLLIKKTLKKIVSKESLIFDDLPRSVIDSKISELSSVGDIRAAIFAFQFWSQWRSHNELEDLVIGKESPMSIFHAVGKCIFGSRTDDDDITVDKVMQDFTNRPDLLKLSLLENYSKFNKSKFDIDTAAEITDNYSLSDLIPTGSISLDCTIRSTRVAFRKTGLASTSDMGLTFPREWKVNKQIRQTTQHIDKYIEVEMRRRHVLRDFQNSNLYHGFFEPLINKDKAFKNKAKLHYLRSQNKPIPRDIIEPTMPYLRSRLGGVFKEIQSDETMVADYDQDNDTNTNEEYFRDTARNADDDSDEDDNGSEFDDDPIMESDDDKEVVEDETFDDDDTFERQLVELSQRKTNTLKPRNAEFFDDFNDDDDYSE